MIIVVDSGSYKSDWMFTPPNSNPLTYRTVGINPFFTSEKEIIKILQHFKEITPYIEDVTEIYFFGSGCTSPDRREIISNAVSFIFKNAFVSVDTDLIGSAYATCGNIPGLISTVGTGSNITFFDGKTVQPNKHGTGFILGDVGSGAWFGKKLITNYLYDLLPSELSTDFGTNYEVSKEIVINKVYQEPRPNSYLASFAPFMAKHIEHPYIINLLYQGFEEFVKTNISSYPDFQNHICHFVGSIAYFYKNQLRAVCEINGIRTGKIIRQPIQDLYAYVLEKETQATNLTI
jgi:glucosamine kinase